jgi:hypothetical protein
MHHNPRLAKADYYLGVYSDPFGIASILLNLEGGKYNIVKQWSKVGLVSLSEGVRETFNLLEGIPYTNVKAYLNDSRPFELLFKKESSNLRIAWTYRVEVDPIESYQIINSLLAEDRITLSEGLDEIESALKSFSLEEVNHIVYSLFCSIAPLEIESMKPKPRVSHSVAIW